MVRRRIIKKNNQRDDQRNRDGPARTVFGIGGAVIHTGLSDPTVSGASSPVNTPTFLLGSRSRDDLESNDFPRRRDPPQGKDLPLNEDSPQSTDSPQSKESPQSRSSPQSGASPLNR